MIVAFTKRFRVLAQLIGPILIAGWHRIRFPFQCLCCKLSDPDMTQCCLQLHTRNSTARPITPQYYFRGHTGTVCGTSSQTRSGVLKVGATDSNRPSRMRAFYWDSPEARRLPVDTA